MSEQNHFYYLLLELNRNASEKEIKRAYAQRLKSIDQAANPAAFTALRAEYERALHFAKNPQQESDFDWLNDEELETPSEPENPNKQKEPVQTVSLSELSLSIQLFFSKLIDQIVLKPYTVDRVKQHFDQYLQRGIFVNLEARILFEKILIEQLAQGNFGDSNLKVLIAAKDYFNWNDAYKFTETNSAIEKVWLLLAQFNSTDKNTLNIIDFLLKKPNSVDSTVALHYYNQLVINKQLFLNFCVSKNKYELWKDAYNERSYFQMMVDYVRPRFAAIPFIKKFLITVTVISFLKFVITTSMMNKAEIDLAKFNNFCDAAYAHAIDNKWQGLRYKQIIELSECALIKQPVTCQDRENFFTLVTIANGLYESKYSFSGPSTELDKYVIFNSSGTDYELTATASCENIKEFMTNARWDLSLDHKALAKVAPRYLECLKNQNQAASEVLSQLNSLNINVPSSSTPAVVLSQNERILFSQLSNSVFAGNNGQNKQQPLLTETQVLSFAVPYTQLTLAHLKEMRHGKNSFPTDRDPLPRSEKLLKQHIEAPLDTSTCININDEVNTNRDNIKNAGPLETQSIIKKF